MSQSAGRVIFFLLYSTLRAVPLWLCAPLSSWNESSRLHCNQIKAKDAFSNKQYNGVVSDRRCKQCLGEATESVAYGEQRFYGAFSSSARASRHRCSGCLVEKERACFSKKQLTKVRADERRCGECTGYGV